MIECWKLHSLMAQGNLAMRLLLSLVIVLLFLGSGTAHAQSGELAMTGEFWAQFVSAKSGEVWLGLYQVGDEYELRSTTLVVNERREDRWDEEFKAVQVDQSTKPLFLVRGLEELRSGKVTTLVHDWKFLYPGQISYFRSDASTRYTLRAVGEAVDQGQSQVAIKNYGLILSGSSLRQVSQTLIGWDRFIDGTTPGVIWAGDLDRDGKLDLFMDTSRHYGYVEYALFLSSAAAEEEFVGKVATWMAGVD